MAVLVLDSTLRLSVPLILATPRVALLRRVGG